MVDSGDRLSVAVFDIDGVLADVRHRLHHLAARPKRWEDFFLAADADPLLADGAALARELAQTHAVLYLTGRPERTRDLTQRWLHQHDLPPGVLLMRPDRDHRPARLFKSEQLRALRREADVAVVVDDDPEVVALLRDQGLTVRQAEWLPYAEPLAQAQESEGRT